MTSQDLDDIKQLLEATISQHFILFEERFERINANLEAKIDSKFDQLRKEMQDGFGGVGEVIDRILEITGDHEQRITRLETA